MHIVMQMAEPVQKCERFKSKGNF